MVQFTGGLTVVARRTVISESSRSPGANYSIGGLMSGNNLTDVDGTLSAAGITITAPGLSGSAKALGNELGLLTPGGQLLHNALANSGLSATKHIALAHSTPATGDVKSPSPLPHRAATPFS
jgi:hypothetical protein